MPYDPHGKDIRTSIYGRLMGLDVNKFLTGFSDVRPATDTLTAASTVAKGGTTFLQATTTAVFEVTPPNAQMVGVRKRIVNQAGAAVPQLVKLTAGNFYSLLGSSHTTISLTTRGAYVDLEYASTAFVFALLQTTSSAASNVSFSTTT